MDPEDEQTGVEEEDEESKAPDEIVLPLEGEPAVVPELDPEVEAEIKKAQVPEALEENSDIPKAKTQQISQALIERELSPEDLLDEGSI